MSEVIIITGASSGIGKAAALAFAQAEDCTLVLVGRSTPASLEETAACVRALGRNCLTLLGDLGDMEFCTQVVRETTAFAHPADLLVNCAGISHIGLFQDMTPQDISRLMNVNLLSVLWLSHAVIPDMIRRGSGQILNVSSVWGNVGASCEAVYSATKGGINSFTRALAKELAPSGIRVNAVAFGAIDTPMNDELDEEGRQLLNEEIPMGRMGTAQEAGQMLVSVARSPQYLTGAVITMDGGWI